MNIRDARAEDESSWRQLLTGYLDFIGLEQADSITTGTWQRILDPDSSLFCRVAENDAGSVIGFANCVLHDGTSVATPICYLEDLYVDQSARGSGVGKALMNDLLALSKSRGWSRLYWFTEHDNTIARHLYDSFRPADDWVRYQIKTGE
ncbi:MAG: GNAT family N-acetyltransferase [Rhodospirillales bacterium]